MGDKISKLLNDYCTTEVNNACNFIGKKRKREEANLVLDEPLQDAKRKKLTCTPSYIHRALFREGKGSDITVNALGTQWKLHKLYLSQSPYFCSMFSGAWKEAREDSVNIEIVDSRINADALNVVFGSLYVDEVILPPSNIIAIVAAATLFQLEGIIDRCAEVMTETLCYKTALPYYIAGCEYGINSVKAEAFRFLLVNLLSRIIEIPEQIKMISKELMIRIVKHPDLFVIQSEFTLYVFLRHWLYLRLNDQTDLIKPEGKLTESSNYFQEIRKDATPVLLTEEGSKYVEVFRALRLQHIIDHSVDVDIITADNIIPQDWLLPYFRTQWYHLLKVNHCSDLGPKEMTFEEFKENAMRMGRVVPKANSMWRWTGFNYGLDLVWSCDEHTVKVKRSHQADSDLVLSQAQRRHIMVRLTVTHVNQYGQICETQSTGLKSISLFKNEQCTLLVLNNKFSYPLYISVNLMCVTPTFVDSLEMKKMDRKQQEAGETQHPLQNNSEDTYGDIGLSSG